MYGETIKNKISELEANLNDKSSGLEQKVQDIAEGVLVVADVVDELPTIIKEEVSSLDNKVSKEIKSLNDKIAKVKTIKGDKGDRGEAGIDGLDGKDGVDGKDGSPDTPEQIADKLNTLEGVIDSKVIKGYNGTDIEDLKRQVSTIGNQTLRLLSKPATSTTTTGGGTVDSIVAGTNVSVDSTDPANPVVSASFTQEGKYMISGGAAWSGTGLTYDVSTLTYFFNGNKTANPTQVTLDASDPINNRFDAIVVDEAGTVTTITGTASANPEVPAIPEDQLQVTIILVAAGSVTPTIASEEIYIEESTSGWTFSTYTTATPATGTINFSGTNSPKQGINDIEASTDLRLGARFVRTTSFDAYQYTMFQVWVRFTGSAVATNKSLNVRFENSAGTLVGNTVNLFSYGLQRNVLGSYQLVVVPITAFGALPATVKGLKVIMAGGTVGVVRQWDVDYMILTNGSVPYANVPTIVFAKDNNIIASAPGINIKQGTGMTITSALNNTTGRVDYTFNAAGGDIQSVKVSLTAKQFTSAIINNTPITLISAPGSGSFIDPLSINAKLTYGTTNYDQGGFLAVGTDTSAVNFKFILQSELTNSSSSIISPLDTNTNIPDTTLTTPTGYIIPVLENESLKLFPYGSTTMKLTGRSFIYSSATGSFSNAETVQGNNSGDTGVVWFDNGSILGVDLPTGSFSGDTSLLGLTSGVTADIDRNNLGGDSPMDIYITYKVVTL